ncbi:MULTISPECIES: hypothetical protein [Streptomyces]|uniref:Uncharacterized protein n=1 Tax=Streptomyces celluloflavus TaxID=58344 RepID=A0ABW7REC1_9ACTN|nr:hypothetical protein [Streptomyces sp. SID7805]MYU55536.1 hypothetical protein [Streptomyces sp. SID7805]WSK10949.1 hypothetical protein OG717_03720 [Streptomyces celluloflavus]
MRTAIAAVAAPVYGTARAAGIRRAPADAPRPPYGAAGARGRIAPCAHRGIPDAAHVS